MVSREQNLPLRQLEALALSKIKQAEQQKKFGGRISPGIVAEVYRIGHQILAILEDRKLDREDPTYLFGLYSALLELQKSYRAEEERLYDRVDTRIVAEIVRLEYMLEQLRDFSPQETETQKPAVIVVQKGLQRLLS